MLNTEELEKYSRQIALKEIGEEGQLKLKNSKVAIVGAGGLGSPCALYLSVSGIGEITLIDKDVVELSNLNRQVLHWHRDIGKPKVISFEEKLKELNPYLKVIPKNQKLDLDNVKSLLAGHDFVVDALDNFGDRLILNKACIELGIPYVHGAVYGFEGEVMTIIPGKSPCIGCRGIRAKDDQTFFPVIGVVPGVIGTIQASEVIKGILGIGELLTDKLLRYNSLTQEFVSFKINKNPKCEYCSSI